MTTYVDKKYYGDWVGHYDLNLMHVPYVCGAMYIYIYIRHTHWNDRDESAAGQHNKTHMLETVCSTREY